MKRTHGKLTEEELKLKEEMERFMEQVNNDPEVANAPVPTNLKSELWRDIREHEAEKEQKEQAAREKELVRLGLIYEKKRKRRKYYMVAAVAILAMAFGITSVGGPEKVFEVFRFNSLGREQTHINSNSDVKQETDFTEDEVYEEIEEKYGFCPVRIIHRPEDVEFQEASINDEIQGINIIYGTNKRAEIIFIMKPNYRKGSMGTDIEDEAIGKFIMHKNDVRILVTKYVIEETGENKWAAEFEYQDVQYFIRVLGREKDDVIKILQNLYF